MNRRGTLVDCTVDSQPAGVQGSSARGLGTFDLISMIQVAAHFHDLRRAFASALATIPDRVQFPYPSEDLFWILLVRRC